ncbi:hypothetical protein BGZ82_005461 [Podila clonocystis]|nr:hypothetical protein BGZ82_005461 [Podila clonocystis]
MSRYVDAEVALSPSSEQLPRELPLGRYGFKSPSRNTLTSSDQWRKSIRQQDTPVAREKRSDASYFHQTLQESDSEDNIINNNGSPDDHPSQRRQQQKQQDRHDHESPRSRKRRQEAAQRVPVNHRQDSDYEIEEEEEDEDEDDDEGLDIGAGEDEQYYHQSPYPDIHDSDEEYLEEELTPEQLAFEEAERKREKEQIGFLERVTNFFWNQMDDIGATPKSLQQYHQQLQQYKSQHHANSDSDASAYSLTSARARSRKAPLKRRSKPGPFLVPSLPKRGSFNVPSMRHLDSGIGMTSWIDERSRTESRDGDIHLREQSRRASVHDNQHSPQELYSDHYQKQQPLYQDDVEDHGYGRPRRRTPSKEYVRPVAMEPAQRIPSPRVYPWHVLGRLIGITRPPLSQPRTRQDTDADMEGRTWWDRVPHVPSLHLWIPSRSARPSHSSNKIYIPTDQITSLEELESRIGLIQQALEEMGQTDDKLGQDLQDKFEGILAKVTNVDRRVNAVDGRIAAVDGRVVDMDGRVTAVDGRIIAMDRRVNDVDGRVTYTDSRLSSTDQRLEKVSIELNSLKEYVSSGQWIEQTILEHVRDEIPKYLVVSRDPHTGKLVIPAEFWDTARSLFATQEQLQTSIQDRDAKANKFLEDNERAMEALVDGRMTKVTRTMFLNLVRTEANQIWQGLEKNVMALLERQGKLQGRTAPSRAVTDPARQLTDVERELISELIDEALEKYSADALAKPDYALFSAGGRIIPRLTSPNYYHEVKLNLLGRLGFRFLVPLPRKEKPAEKAIEPSVHAGECWAMNGQEGQLAIRLARKIIVTEVTIEHADASVVLDMGSAAKEIEIWSLKGSEDAAPVSASPATSEVAAEDAGDEKESTMESGSSETVEDKNKTVGSWWSSGIPWPGATLLDTIEFDADTSAAEGGDDATEVRRKPKSRQTFAIPLSKQTSPSVGVVLRIKSNWGHPLFTCVYRVRVHGYEPSDPSASTSTL